MENAKQIVARFIAENKLLSPSSSVLAGLSGGPDSVCLALILHELGYKVIAVHCNFHLRGEESERDEAFAESFAKQLGIPFYKTHFDTATWANEHKVSIEMAARELRYAYFRTLKDELSCQAIAVGHHQDDNVETLLLNMVRGTGIQGASAIQPKNGDIIRPLLCLTRKEILDYLNTAGQPYVIDRTNLEDEYSRNKIRLDIIPLLESINPSASSNIASTIENLNEVRKIYLASIKSSIDKCASTNAQGETIIDFKELLRQPSPISVLHEVLSPFGFNKKQIKSILASMSETGKTFASPTKRALIDRECLIIEADSYPIPEIEKIAVTKAGLSIMPDANIAYIDSAKVKGELTIRFPKPGDTFAPFGMKGKRKLVSDFLTDKKLSRFAKEHQPLLCDGEEIVWIIGLRASDKYRIDENTKNVLILKTKSEE